MRKKIEENPQVLFAIKERRSVSPQQYGRGEKNADKERDVTRGGREKKHAESVFCQLKRGSNKPSTVEGRRGWANL